MAAQAVRAPTEPTLEPETPYQPAPISARTTSPCTPSRRRRLWVEETFSSPFPVSPTASAPAAARRRPRGTAAREIRRSAAPHHRVSLSLSRNARNADHAAGCPERRRPVITAPHLVLLDFAEAISTGIAVVDSASQGSNTLRPSPLLGLLPSSSSSATTNHAPVRPRATTSIPVRHLPGTNEIHRSGLADACGVNSMQLFKGYREFSLKEELYKGKLLIPPVRNQLRTSTCFIHSSCTCVEALYKRKCALANPQTDFEVIFSADHLIDQYTQKYGSIGKEDDKKIGFDRVTRTLELLKDFGVTGFKDETEHPSEPVQMLQDGFGGNFTIGTCDVMVSVDNMGEIYKYDKQRPFRIGGRTFSHSVAIIGYGMRAGVGYYVYQNSKGERWGEKGIGRVDMESITNLIHVKV
ncbi:hypothetical protein ACP70R_019576 [Stipagrostis hirtigluma subsp. patula]